MKTGLHEKTAGIVGLGKTGGELARLLKQFNMKVLGWRRSTEKPEDIDTLYSSDRGGSIQPILAESDYIILCAGLNDQTWHLLGEREFSLMKKSAFVINMGRGALIDENSLICAIKNGDIAGAGLDTFEKEPLAESSPLWDMPNVIITPRITPRLPDREERALNFVYENIEAYRKGSGFINRLTERDIYTKGNNRRS
jgi:phosphoglycerate dehydrogenase-like enzyme